MEKLLKKYREEFDIKMQENKNSSEDLTRNVGKFIRYPKLDENSISWWLKNLNLKIPFGKEIQILKLIDILGWNEHSIRVITDIFNTTRERNASFELEEYIEIPYLDEISNDIEVYLVKVHNVPSNYINWLD